MTSNNTIFAKEISKYATEGVPFIFIIDFELEKPLLFTLQELSSRDDILYDIKGLSNAKKVDKKSQIEDIKSFPIEKNVFAKKLQNVIEHINNGDSYLLNLTFATEIEINLSLRDIFHHSTAPYKLFIQDNFVVFSPECFIKIEDDKIYTFPMKGTIDASIPNAIDDLMHNIKEEKEHNTIVDLMRNDIAMVSSDVEVIKYRYIDRIKRHKGEILQTSSQIIGLLANNWKENLGEMIIKLLPAGSISGAPKKKTIEIISNIETDKRGYYSGVFGLFDGAKLDSAVMIRYIEERNGKMFFRSGGGITAQSNLSDEYNELIQKIYVPII